MPQFKVTFNPTAVEVVVDSDKAPAGGIGEPGCLLDIALSNGVEIEHDCGGAGVCGTCYVLIEQGAESLSPKSEDEAATLENMTDNAPEGRLACQAIPNGDVTVRILSA